MEPTPPFETAELARTIREMIQHENTLINERMKWLLSSQTFLFAAVGLAWNDHPAILYTIALAGIMVCVSLGIYLRCGIRAVHELHQRWEEHRRTQPAAADWPVIGLAKGSLPPWTHFLLPWYLLPPLFSLCWAALVLAKSFS